jgi:hypothetical protein
MAETPVGARTEDRMPLPAVTSANGSHSLPASPEQTVEAERLRGVIGVTYEQDILLTDEVSLASDQRPRWLPQIVVDERRLVDDDRE